MGENTINQIKSFNSRSVAVRIVVTFAFLLTLTVAFFGARWQIGNLLAEATAPTDETAQQTAELATQLAPNEPLAYWLAGNAIKNSFADGSLEKAITQFEKAAAVSPNDYRFWIDLGRSREQNGETSGAEKAFLRAVELAPTYGLPRWNFGNFLLRNDRKAEAFAEFRRVAENHSTLRNQVFFLVWEVLDEKPADLEKVVGDAPQIRASLAMFYAGRDFPEDALRQWQSLNAAEREQYKQIGETASRALYDKRRFRTALSLIKELNFEPETTISKITNPSFENPISDAAKSYFDWKVTKIKNLDISLDPSQKNEGKRGLRLSFSGFTEPNLQNVTQFIVTEQGARYRLTFAVKTNELKSAGLPLVELTDTDKFKVIASSAGFPSGSNDWKQMSLEFTAPNNSDAVMIRVARNFCGEGCPIVGTVWLDEFKLEKKS